MKTRSSSSTTKQKKPAKRRANEIIKPGMYGHKWTFRNFRTFQNQSEIVSSPLPPPPPPPLPKNPKLNSFRLPPAESATELERIAMDWILKDLLNIIYKDSIVPIIPYHNSIRMCHQSPQAMRLFFSAPVTKNELSDEAVSQTTDELPTIPRKKICQGYVTFVNTFDEALRKSRKRKTWGNGSEQIQSIRKERVEENPARKKTKTNKKTKADNIEELYSYGLLSVLTTTGFHPTQNVKVRPFCESLQEIARLLTEEVKKHLKPNPEHYTDELDFNHMEVKLYHGKDIYRDKDGCPLKNNEGKEIRDDCNKIVNFHNDLSFNDQGEQSLSDTAKGDHPIVTLTIGATRKLTFKHKWKRDSSWSDGETLDFELNQGSIFCLLPNDEKPKKIENILHKTQHMAKFSKEGISIALVFRSIKKKSIFHKETHRWEWKEDKYYKQKVRTYLRKRKGHYKDMQYREGTAPEEVTGMMENVIKFLRDMKEGNRFLSSG